MPKQSYLTPSGQMGLTNSDWTVPDTDMFAAFQAGGLTLNYAVKDAIATRFKSAALDADNYAYVIPADGPVQTITGIGIRRVAAIGAGEQLLIAGDAFTQSGTTITRTDSGSFYAGQNIQLTFFTT